MPNKVPVVHIQWDYGTITDVFGPTKTVKSLCGFRARSQYAVTAAHKGATCPKCLEVDAKNQEMYKRLEVHIDRQPRKEKGYEAEQ